MEEIAKLLVKTHKMACSQCGALGATKGGSRTPLSLCCIYAFQACAVHTVTCTDGTSL